MATRVLLLVGTKKGGFILESDTGRRAWSMRGPTCDGFGVLDMTPDRTTGTLYAGTRNPFYGPAVFRSDDLGETWTLSSEGLTYGDDQSPVTAVWNVTPAHGMLYAGAEPAGLFRSADGGRTFSHVTGLTEHPTRPTWQPGNGGLILHTIIPHPTDAQRMWVGISSVGTFATDDGGRTWRPQNRGVRACFMPDPFPETGQCVHKIAMAAGRPDRLYQQNHCGVYRSDDAGESWQEVTAGLPSEFGFVMATHPRDPETAWTMPLNGADQGRFVPDGRPAVWRTRDAGATWTRHAEGFPAQHAYLGVLREAMAVDTLEPAGIYVGTSTGQVYGSADEGSTWREIAAYLPPIASVETLVVDA